MKRVKHHPQAGFSLIETIAAMAILAVAAIPLMQMTTTSVQHARGLETRMLARTVAENTISVALAQSALIPGGILAGTEAQMGRAFNWTLTTTPPLEGQLQRFDVIVSAEGNAQVLSQMTSLKLIPLPVIAPAEEPIEDNGEGQNE